MKGPDVVVVFMFVFSWIMVMNDRLTLGGGAIGALEEALEAAGRGIARHFVYFSIFLRCKSGV